jgi:hypothetical protein
VYAGQILFAQLMDFVPWTTFARLFSNRPVITALLCPACAAERNRKPA